MQISANYSSVFCNYQTVPKNIYANRPFSHKVQDSFSPSFQGKSKLETAQIALEKLQEKLESDTQLTKQDEIWLKPLREKLGTTSFTVNNPDNPKEKITVDSTLTIDKINQKGGIKTLFDALTTMIAATKYQPT